MPQLDKLTYFSQSIFLIFSYVSFYMLVLYIIIPKTVGIRKLRKKFNTIERLFEIDLKKRLSFKESTEETRSSFDYYDFFYLVRSRSMTFFYFRGDALYTLWINLLQDYMFKNEETPEHSLEMLYNEQALEALLSISVKEIESINVNNLDLLKKQNEKISKKEHEINKLKDLIGLKKLTPGLKTLIKSKKLKKKKKKNAKKKKKI